MTKKMEWFLLCGVLLFALILRIDAISTTVVRSPIRGDAIQYYFGALNLQRWGVFSTVPPDNVAPNPDSLRPPLVPYILQTVATFPPTKFMLLKFNFIQALLDVGTVLFTFLLFRLLAGRGIALVSALLVAGSPHLISMTTYLLTETTFTFFLSGSMCLAAYALVGEKIWMAAIAGIFLGLSALTRETTTYFPFFILICSVVFVGKRKFVRIIIPVVCVSLCVILAWTLRNLVETGHMSDPTLAVNTIHHGMYPDMMYNDDPRTAWVPYRYDPQSPEMKNTGDVLDILKQRFLEQPQRYLRWFLIGKPLAFLQWDLQESQGDVFVYPVTQTPFLENPLFIFLHKVFYVLHIPLTIAAFLGAILYLWGARILIQDEDQHLVGVLLTCLLVYFLLVHMVGFPLARYSIPLRPYVYGLGVSVVWSFCIFAVRWCRIRISTEGK